MSSDLDRLRSPLTTKELTCTERYWMLSAQQMCFAKELRVLTTKGRLSGGKLLPLHPIIGEDWLLRVGGRLNRSSLPYNKRRPIILPAKHKLTELIIRQEHYYLLYAGPTLVAASLSSRFCIIGVWRAVCVVTRSCVTCRKVAGNTALQVLGQVPPDRVAPRLVFDQAGVDYARPVLIKSGSVRRPLITKS